MKWDSESWSECGMHDRREFILERRVHIRLRYVSHSDTSFSEFTVECIAAQMYLTRGTKSRKVVNSLLQGETMHK